MSEQGKFSESEIEKMIEACDADEVYGAAAIIADKACGHLNFDKEQIDRWRGKMMSAISKSNISKIWNALSETDKIFILEKTLESTVTNYVIEERIYQDSLKHPPE